MNKHLQYLWYVLKHKFFVYQEGRKLGLGRWQLLIHDWQKFTRAEWTPYVNKFFAPEPIFSEDKKKVHEAFQRAWLHHQHCSGGMHHWQHWIQVSLTGAEDLGRSPLKAIEMPYIYAFEMIADWKAMARTKGGVASVWYVHNQDKMWLHPNTRKLVERILMIKSVSHPSFRTGGRV